MGNCSFKGVVAAEEQHCRTRNAAVVQVLSGSGQVLQFQEHILVQKILTNFPGFGVFRHPVRLSSPLSGHESLVGGQLYYLLPLSNGEKSKETEQVQGTEQLEEPVLGEESEAKKGAKKKKSLIVKTQKLVDEVEAEMLMKKKKKGQIEAARTSSVDELTNGSALEVLPSKGNGVWRVKLMINTKQLEEILSEQVNTEALIERMRSAASSSSETVTPRTRRARNSWGGVNWKPTLYNVLRVQNDQK